MYTYNAIVTLGAGSVKTKTTLRDYKTSESDPKKVEAKILAKYRSLGFKDVTVKVERISGSSSSGRSLLGGWK